MALDQRDPNDPSDPQDPRDPRQPRGPGGFQPGDRAPNIPGYSYNALRDIYRSFNLPDPTPDEAGFWARTILDQGWNSLDQLRQAIGNTGEAQAARKQTPAPPPGGGGSGGGSTGSLYGPFGPFQGSFQPLQGTPTAWTNLPAAPQWKDIPTFTAPTMAQAQQDPGYAFGLQQGQQALTQDKAQQGMLYGGGTLKDILAWGQNYATQRYNDVYNRQRDQFMMNTQNQYILPYQAQMQAWQTLVPAGQRQNEFLTNTNYQKWLADFNMWNSNRSYALDVASRLG